jgi:AraC-like DNA-binding protein
MAFQFIFPQTIQGFSKRETLRGVAGKASLFQVVQKDFTFCDAMFEQPDEVSITCKLDQPIILFCLEDDLMGYIGDQGSVELKNGEAIIMYGPSTNIKLPLDKQGCYHLFLIRLTLRYTAQYDRNKVLKQLIDAVNKKETESFTMPFSISEEMQQNIYLLSNTQKGNEKGGTAYWNVLQLFKASLKEAGIIEKKISSPEYDTVLQARAYLEQHVSQPIPVHQLSRNAGLTTPRLANKFTSFTGCTSAQFITRLRLQKVEELLIHTNDTIETISAKAGFIRYENMHIAFTKELQLSPREYRKNAQKSH